MNDPVSVPLITNAALAHPEGYRKGGGAGEGGRGGLGGGTGGAGGGMGGDGGVGGGDGGAGGGIEQVVPVQPEAISPKELVEMLFIVTVEPLVKLLAPHRLT